MCKITIQINRQLDATISPVYYLTFIYSSTCFGRPHAHHQELNDCSSSLWFYRWSVVVAVLLVVKMGVRTPETCWVVHKRQVINRTNCCIWLVDLFENDFVNFVLFQQENANSFKCCSQKVTGDRTTSRGLGHPTKIHFNPCGFYLHSSLKDKVYSNNHYSP